MKFGLLIPSFSSLWKHPTKPETLRRFVQKAEDLGYDSLWLIDHFVMSPAYGQTWLDPLTMLTYAAAVTTRIKLGTNILVVPLRNPVLLAKEIASLQFLSGGRYQFGVGPGWNPADFATVGVPRRERGSRTDEIIEICRRLWTEENVTHRGKHYQFDNVTIEPRLDRVPPLWVGGGSQPAMKGSSEYNRLAESVKHRIAKADGYLAMPQTIGELLREDWAQIQACARELGRDPAQITFAQMNYYHIVETKDRAQALEIQQRYFDRYTGEIRRFDYVKACYLVGTLDEILERIDERRRIGAEYAILGPVTVEPDILDQQLDLLTKRIVPAFPG